MGHRLNKPTYHKSISNGIPLDNPFVKSRKVSTLLIPPNLAGFVKKRGIVFLLEKTLESQRDVLKAVKRINNTSPYTRYQKILKKNSKEHYIKMNFRPKQRIWSQLRSLAIANGISMCYLFVILLETYMAAQNIEKQKDLLQMKVTLYVNVEKNIFFRELWITEVEKKNSLQLRSGRGNGPPDPKIA